MAHEFEHAIGGSEQDAYEIMAKFLVRQGIDIARQIRKDIDREVIGVGKHGKNLILELVDIVINQLEASQDETAITKNAQNKITLLVRESERLSKKVNDGTQYLAGGMRADDADIKDVYSDVLNNVSALAMILPKILNGGVENIFAAGRLSKQEIFSNGEIWFFLNSGKKTGGDLKGYLSQLSGIKYIAESFLDEKSLEPTELFVMFQEVSRAKDFIRHRWVKFIAGYYKNILFSADYTGALRQRVLDPNFNLGSPEEFLRERPEFRMCFEQALGPYYRPLFILESRLKAELGIRKEKDSTIVTAIMRYLHDNKEVYMQDSVIDWLLDLQVAKTEASVSDFLETRYTGEVSGYGVQSGGTPYNEIRTIVDKLNLGSQDVLYDLGSGYGRLIFYARMTTEAGRTVGLELVSERVDQCNRARQDLMLDKIEFKKANCRYADFRDGTVFFLFSPFSESTMQIVGEKLRNIARTKKIRIIVKGPSRAYFDKQDWAKEVDNFGDIYVFESTITPASTRDSIPNHIRNVRWGM
jgi:hypothetical protein